jgi:hypothetical protein
VVKRGLLLTLVAGCNFAPLDPKTLYRCEVDGSCAQRNFICREDLRCHPPDSGMCVPLTCEGHCGQLDDGCGRQLSCPGCSGADVCGGGGPNRCGQQVCSANGWCWENPYPQGNALHGVWAAASDDIWAVGDVGTVLHFNGRLWTAVPFATRSNLHGIFGTAPDDVWIVGDSGLVLHWDGTDLKSESADTPNDLNGVWAAPGGTVWIAGTNSTLGMRSPAGVWRLFQPATLNVSFRAIWALSPSDVWAVGDKVIERYDGARFVRVPLTLPNQAVLNTLWSPGDSTLLTAGNAGVFASWDGGSWAVASLGGNLWNTRQVFGSSADDFWLVGDKGVWRSLNGNPQVQLTTTAFNAGCALDGGEALVVGNAGNWAFVGADGGLRSSWSGAALTPDLNDVFALSASSVVAVGGVNAWFERFANAGIPSWRRYQCATGFTSTMQSVWVAPGGAAFATANANNTVGFQLGTNQCRPGFDTATTYSGIWGFPSGPVHYVGDQFTRVITDGGQPPNFIELPNPGSSSWSSVWGSTPAEMFAVGTAGGLSTLSDYHAGWVPAAGPTLTADLTSVHGTGAGASLEVWAVGAQGTVVRRQGGQPFTFVSAPMSDLRDVWVGSAQEVWAVGTFGSAWRFNGGDWAELPAPVRDLRRIYGMADAGVWAVGAGGAILFHP